MFDASKPRRLLSALLVSRDNIKFLVPSSARLNYTERLKHAFMLLTGVIDWCDEALCGGSPPCEMNLQLLTSEPNEYLLSTEAMRVASRIVGPCRMKSTIFEFKPSMVSAYIQIRQIDTKCQLP